MTHPNAPAHQRGAALLVAMILIFVLALLGASTMRGASLGQHMTTNAIIAQDMLQATESANEIVLNDLANLTAVHLTESDTLEIETDMRGDLGMRSRVVLRYVGEGNAVGYSLDASQGAGGFAAQRYVVEGEASIAGLSTLRRVDQGAYRIAPSSGSSERVTSETRPR